MNLTKKMKTLALVASLLVTTSAYAAGGKSTSTAEQGWWKWNEGSTPTYSDIPNNMRPGSATWYNTRGRVMTVNEPKPQQDLSTMSLADQQRVLNERIAKQNEEAEKKNKEVEEENRKMAEENCKRAQMNRQNAENARVANREELIARYSQDVAKFCR